MKPGVNVIKHIMGVFYGDIAIFYETECYKNFAVYYGCLGVSYTKILTTKFLGLKVYG